LSRVLEKLERVGRHRNNRVVRVAVRAARSLIRGFDGPQSVLRDMAHNGEKRVLDQLGGELKVVFDVGANIGDWTQNALAAGAARVHAFEISPSTSAGLATRYADDDRVTVNTFGLSSAAGTVTIHHYPDHPALTTVTDYPHDAESTAIEVPVRTGDEYVAEMGVDRIDFLKLDVEGAEEHVIAGFAKTFERGAVRVVQFEYGRVSILTKYLLRDFYADMTKHGFTVGQINPNGVTFRPYDLDMEQFNDSNWLAVHSSCPELIGRVS
jgi:FkbM family methyltransferase